MEIVVAILGLILIVGLGLAIYEWRKGKIVLEHDLSETGPQTEADREALRANDVLKAKMTIDGMGGGVY